MTKFNPDNLDIVTYGEMFDYAIQAETKEEAKQYLNDYATYIMEKTGNDFGASFSMAKENLCYYTRLYDNDTIAMVFELYDLFDVEYPDKSTAKKDIPDPLKSLCKFYEKRLSDGTKNNGISFREFA
jgi:hypothetical protein